MIVKVCDELKGRGACVLLVILTSATSLVSSGIGAHFTADCANRGREPEARVWLP